MWRACVLYMSVQRQDVLVIRVHQMRARLQDVHPPSESTLCCEHLLHEHPALPLAPRHTHTVTHTHTHTHTHTDACTHMHTRGIDTTHLARLPVALRQPSTLPAQPLAPLLRLPYSNCHHPHPCCEAQRWGAVAAGLHRRCCWTLAAVLRCVVVCCCYCDVHVHQRGCRGLLVPAWLQLRGGAAACCVGCLAHHHAAGVGRGAGVVASHHCSPGCLALRAAALQVGLHACAVGDRAGSV